MISRCYNEKDNAFHNYGARGISVCEEWLNDIKAFYNWVISSGYQENLQLERIDNNKGYFPNNCSFVTRKVQTNNRRSNRLISAFGETKSLSEWGEIYNINPHTLRYRIEKGMPPEEALLKPITTSRRNTKALQYNQLTLRTD